MSDLIGRHLGRYHILEQLGEGGMATVYKAYDTRLEADVAVKVIRTEALPQNAVERALKRFEREAKALARLTHPNIVKVMDYGEYEGKPYLVMPFLPGGTLKQQLGKPGPWRDSVQLLIPIAEALAYAHEHEIIHRDIKPSNILITEKGQPMLSDFGVAKLLDLEETQELTATGVGVGTPEYMAPEQGSSRSVDDRVDIYSLGVVLYEMLTGRKPYTADTPLAVLIKSASEPLPRPGNYVKDLPDAVEKVLLKALAKKPEDRYASMEAFCKALSALHSEPQITRARKLDLSPSQPESLAGSSQHSVQLYMAWTILGIVVLIAAAFFLLREPRNGFIFPGFQQASPTATQTPVPTYTPYPTETAVPTETIIPTATPYMIQSDLIRQAVDQTPSSGNVNVYGTFRLGEIPFSSYSSRSLDIQLYNRDTKEWFGPVFYYDPQTSEYVIMDLAPGDYSAVTELAGSNNQYQYVAGAYWSQRLFEVGRSSGFSSMRLDMPVEWVMHFTQPFDNASATTCSPNNYDSYRQGQMTFQWDPVPEAVIYRGKIQEYKDDSTDVNRILAEINGSGTAYTIDIPSSPPGTYYGIFLYAYDRNGTEIALLMSQGGMCHGWQYHFRVK